MSAVPVLIPLYYAEKTPTLDGYERDFLRKLGYRFDEVGAPATTRCLVH